AARAAYCASGIAGFGARALVVTHAVARGAPAAGLDVPLALAGVASPAVGERARQEALHAFEPWLELAGHGVAGHAGDCFGDLAQGKPAARRAGNFDPPVAQL